MLKTEVVSGGLPYRVEIDGLKGAGVSASIAAMAALSAGGRIPTGMRDAKAAACHIFWHHEANPDWVKLISILEQDARGGEDGL